MTEYEPLKMVLYQYAQICGDGHIRYRADTADGLSNDTHCDICGTTLYKHCPDCDAPVRVRGTETRDGDIQWNHREHCYNCGDGLPWKPSRWSRIKQNLAQSNPSPSPGGTLLYQSMREAVEETNYGHEVINHIRDGDKCYKSRLWHPALGSYIHAFEWAAITYLEDQADLDIIEKENEGVLYYFARGENNLIDELQEHVDIDQKTIESIKRMNQAERNWMAHHKSGKTLQTDVDAVRARLGEFLKTLFQKPDNHTPGDQPGS